MKEERGERNLGLTLTHIVCKRERERERISEPQKGYAAHTQHTQTHTWHFCVWKRDLRVRHDKNDPYSSLPLSLIITQLLPFLITTLLFILSHWLT